MKWDLEKVLKNPDIAVQQSFGSGDGAPAALRLAIEQRLARNRTLADRFEQLWAELKGPELTPEYTFHPDRQWRADYCHKPTRVLIELEGGTWINGAHVRGKRYAEDCEKYNAALVARYAVFRLTSEMINAENVQMIIDHIRAVR